MKSPLSSYESKQHCEVWIHALEVAHKQRWIIFIKSMLWSILHHNTDCFNIGFLRNCMVMQFWISFELLCVCAGKHVECRQFSHILQLPGPSCWNQMLKLFITCRWGRHRCTWHWQHEHHASTFEEVHEDSSTEKWHLSETNKGKQYFVKGVLFFSSSAATI